MIVVIAILATITVVSYLGITDNAIEATLKTELSNMSKQLELYKVEHNDVYPSSSQFIKECTSTQASDSSNFCYKLSNNMNLDYTVSIDFSDYLLVGSNAEHNKSAYKSATSEIKSSTATGKNLFDIGTIDDYYIYNQTLMGFRISGNTLTAKAMSSAMAQAYSNKKISYTPNTTLVASASFSGNSRFLIEAYDINDNKISSINITTSGWTYNVYYAAYVSAASTVAFSCSDANVAKIRWGVVFWRYPYDGGEYSISNIQIELGTVATSYEPYISSLH